MSDSDHYDDIEPDYSDFGEDEGHSSSFVQWPRDPQIDPAKEALLKWFESHPNDVFYGRQLEVIFEKKYFHWITHKALKELTAELLDVASELRTRRTGAKLRLYWSRRNRYWKRAAKQIVALVDQHSDPEITRAIGHHAETLFAVAAGREGFKIHGPSIRSYKDREWSFTEHDLDWIFERDGLGWGVEIKNTWAYIDRGEMETKIKLCSRLGVKPLFIMRWAPKSYIEIIRLAGGFGLLYEHQFFPLGQTAAMARLQGLHLPVINPTAVPSGTFERFLKWHVKGVSL